MPIIVAITLNMGNEDLIKETLRILNMNVEGSYKSIKYFCQSLFSGAHRYNIHLTQIYYTFDLFMAYVYISSTFLQKKLLII